TVMVLYAHFLKDAVPGALGHLLTASLLNAPAAIVMARLLVPANPGDEATPVKLEGLYSLTMDAITCGTGDGLKLLLNITAMLVALVALVNMILGLAPHIAGAPISLERALGWLMAPVAWAIGIPWAEAFAAGQLIGTKVVLNELLAYLQMENLSPARMSESSKLIMTYALCGFANFGSLGIMLGGLGAMAPERCGEITALGLKSILSGLMPTLLTGALVGVLLHITA
ncbi:MAG: CNT family concentrative nucleoside transporter, partial [Alphaproteobacteria bacterium]